MKKLPNILGLTDVELQQVTDAAATLEVGKRSLFLIWFVAFYEQRVGDIRTAINHAMRGLRQELELHRRG